MIIYIPPHVKPEDRVQYLMNTYKISEHDAKILVKLHEEE